MPAPAGARHRSPWRAVKDFYRKAYEDNLTGLSGMVAYNLLLSVFPLALLALFIAGRLLESADLEQSVLQDLRQLFPTATDATLTSALGARPRLLDQLRRGRARGERLDRVVVLGRAGHRLLSDLPRALPQLGASRSASRSAMLVVVLLFMAATVAVPTLQSLLVASADDLPLGLSEVDGLVFGVTLAAGLLLLFGILCLIYWAVPNRRLPWRAIWPGRAGRATVAIGVVDYAFPFYLSNINTIARFGTTFVFVVIVLIWFYALAIIILSGATINAMRFEIHETGELQRRADRVHERSSTPVTRRPRLGMVGAWRARPIAARPRA